MLIDRSPVEDVLTRVPARGRSDRSDSQTPGLAVGKRRVVSNRTHRLGEVLPTHSGA